MGGAVETRTFEVVKPCCLENPGKCQRRGRCELVDPVTFFSPKHLSDNPQQELTYAREHWLLPCRYRDLFHSDGISVESCVTYDKYDLLMVETRDPLGNRVTVGERDASGNVNPESPGYDYRLFTTKAGHKREPQPY